MLEMVCPNVELLKPVGMFLLSTPKRKSNQMDSIIRNKHQFHNEFVFNRFTHKATDFQLQ
jgi:2-polyprenyl-3-methyl-5-hydroxy-6-metoxy-1,4-benzoquinol methylase